MRTLLKILLIVVPVATAVASLLFFMKTRLYPPVAISHHNIHAANVQQRIAHIMPEADADTLDKGFFEAHHLIGFLDDNDLLTAQESDSLKSAMLDAYVPAWVAWCRKAFRAPTWYESDLKRMRRRIPLVKHVVRRDGSRIVDRGTEACRELDDVLAVVQRHDSATALAAMRGFVDIDVARRRVARARAYQADDDLRHDIHLVAQLDSLPRRLERAHYRHLRQRVDALAGYRDMQEAAFRAKAAAVDDALNDYGQQASSVYGTSQSLASLRADLAGWRARAEVYYKSRQLKDWLGF